MVGRELDCIKAPSPNPGIYSNLLAIPGYAIRDTGLASWDPAHFSLTRPSRLPLISSEIPDSGTLMQHPELRRRFRTISSLSGPSCLHGDLDLGLCQQAAPAGLGGTRPYPTRFQSWNLQAEPLGFVSPLRPRALME